MEDRKEKKETSLEKTPKQTFDNLLEKAKELDHQIDDHEGMIIGDRLGKLKERSRKE